MACFSCEYFGVVVEKGQRPNARRALTRCQTCPMKPIRGLPGGLGGYRKFASTCDNWGYFMSYAGKVHLLSRHYKYGQSFERQAPPILSIPIVSTTGLEFRV